MTASARITAFARSAKNKKTKRALTDDEKQEIVAFGRAISERRIRLRMSRVVFAEKIGLSYSNTANIETGQNWPGIPVLKRIFPALKLSTPKLLR